MENENEEPKKVEVTEEPKKVEAQKPQEPKKKKGGALKTILLVIVIIIALVALGLLVRYSIVKDSYFAPFEKLFGTEKVVEDVEKTSSKEEVTTKENEKLSLLSEDALAKGVDHYTVTVDVPKVVGFGLNMFNSFIGSMGTDENTTENALVTGIEKNEDEIDDLLKMLDGTELVLDIYAKNDKFIQIVGSLEYLDALKKVYDYAVENDLEGMEDFDSYNEFESYVQTTLDIYLTKSNLLDALDSEMQGYGIDIYDYEDDLEINKFEGGYEIYFTVNKDLNEMFTDYIDENSTELEEEGIDTDDFLSSVMDQIDENLSMYGISAEKE